MEPLITKFATRDELTEKERECLTALPARIREFSAGDEIVPEDTPIEFSSVILEGLGCRQKVFGDGRRQIIAFHVPGDFCDLHSYLLKRMEHGVTAVSSCQVAIVPHHRLRLITDTEPHLTRMLWISTLIDAAINREWIVNLGRRSTFGRIAHLFCELFVRFKAVGLIQGFEYALPLTQTDLSDATGISLVHTNRTLATLRRERLVTFSHRNVRIHDWKALTQAAEFDPGYLHLERLPR